MVKKKRLHFWSRFDAKYLFRVFFKISEQLSNYSSISIWIAFIPGGQYSYEATMCSESICDENLLFAPVPSSTLDT